MTENKPKKKQGWEYAKEAREAKAKLFVPHTADGPVTPEKPKVKSVEPTVSTPDTDFNAGVISMNFERRAGLETYTAELEQRLLDLSEAPDGVYFMLPVKLPKTVYKLLLEAAFYMAQELPDWTERDMLEAIVLFSNAKVLTSKKG